MKLIRAICLQYLAGNPVLVVKEFIRLDKRGIPKDLGPMSELLTSDDKMDLRFLLTLLCVLKAFKGPIIPNFTSITLPGPTVKVEDFTENIHRVFRWLKVKKSSLTCDFTSYHLSTKSSPSGKNAIVDSLSEVLKLKSMSLKESICVLGGLTLRDKYDKLSACLDPSRVGTADTVRSVSAIPDKEGKTRVIAKLDYWSQCALKPLHEELFKLLAKFPQDCTFNQSAFTKELMTGPWYSFDLKDATDRFPIALQQEVLSYLIGKERATAWAHILISEKYTSESGPIAYAVGQPMGAYSSWAAFSVTHHVVVQIAAMEVKKFPFNKYHLLGDDIVIGDSEVAAQYEKIMLSLGVIFSPTKTFKSNKLFEFASRVFLNREEISPFALSGLEESSKQLPSIVEFLRTMQSHGWELFREGNTPGQILSLLKIWGNPAFARWAPMISTFWSLPFNTVTTEESMSCEALTLTANLSCFENQLKPRLRNALILEFAKILEIGLTRVTETQYEWGLALGTSSDDLRFVSGQKPADGLDIPIFGVFQDLRRKVHALAADVSTYIEMYSPDLIPPFDEWLKTVVEISNPPSFQKAKTERKHVQITLIKSSLMFRAMKRARRT